MRSSWRARVVHVRLAVDLGNANETADLCQPRPPMRDVRGDPITPDA